MSGIFKIISQYQGKLIMFPILTLLFVLATFAFFILDKGRKTKYLPAILGIISGIILIFIGWGRLTHPSGLKTVWYGLATFTAACIALGSAWLLTIFATFSHTPKTSGRTGGGRKPGPGPVRRVRKSPDLATGPKENR